MSRAAARTSTILLEAVAMTRLVLASALLAWGTLTAQVQKPTANPDQTQWVTASASVEQLRCTAPASVYEMRLEVFAATGESLYDSGFKSGNLLDWALQDQRGQRLGYGSYRSVVTVKELSGQTRQKRGMLALHSGSVSLPPLEPGTLASRNMNSPSTIDPKDFWTILDDGAASGVMHVGHDGRQGQLAVGRGALSVRTGDVFAGKDVERIHLTEEGDLGIGVEKPQAKLDVAGMIRTDRGIMFPDGTIQTTAPTAVNGTVGASAPEAVGKARPGESTAAAAPLAVGGGGTAGSIPKWKNASDLGDSVLREVNGNIAVAGGDLQLDYNRGLFFGTASLAARKRALLLTGPNNTVMHIGSDSVPLGVERIDLNIGSVGSVMTVNSDGVRLDSNRKLFFTGSSGVLKSALSLSRLGLEQYVLHIGGVGVPAGVDRIDFDIGRVGNMMMVNSDGLRLSKGALLFPGSSGALRRALSISSLGLDRDILHIGSGGSLGVNQIDFDLGPAGNVMRIRDGGVHIGDIFGGAGAASLSVDGAGRAFGMLVRGGSVANGVGVHALGNFIGIAGFGKYGVRGDSDSSDGAGGLFRNTAGGPALVVEGLTITKVLQITGGADLSEEFDIKAAPDVEGDAPPQQVRPGSVVSIDPGNPGKLVVSGQAYDRRVAGIISGAGGVNPGMLMGQSGSIAAGSHPVALTGRVYCWADASNGPIGPGDLLTSSDVPGHAMKVTNYASAQGSIIGKAMTSLPDGKGLVLVLVTLQ